MLIIINTQHNTSINKVTQLGYDHHHQRHQERKCLLDERGGSFVGSLTLASEKGEMRVEKLMNFHLLSFITLFNR